MATNKTLLVSELDASKDFVNMKLRLIRRWINPIGKLDMIFIDEKGQKIQASVRKDLVKNFTEKLKEDVVYLIKKFGVGVFDDPYPVVKQTMKMNFYTCTELCPNVAFNSDDLYGFSFTPFQQINVNLARDDSVLNIDVIGCLIHNGNMDIFGSAKGQSKRVNIELKDLEGRICKCTLWNDYAGQLYNFLKNNQSSEHVIMIIQHVKVKEWRDNICIQSDKFGTRLFVNEDIQEMLDFRRRLIIAEGTAGTSLTTLSTQTVYPNRLEFLVNYQRKHLDEIRDAEMTGEFIVPATIAILENELGWFFIGCRKCNRKVLTKTEYLEVAKAEELTDALINSAVDSIWCRKERVIATQVAPMFRVTFRVQDDTGSASFVMWNRDVQKVVGLSATDIRERQLKTNDADGYPHELDVLLNKKLAFHIKIDRYNLDHKGSAYTVLKMCDDPDIIAELIAVNDEQEVQEDPEEESVSAVKVPESSQGGLDSKDARSVTGDSSAVDVEKDTETSPMQKRPIDTVTPGVSSTNKVQKKIRNIKMP